MPTHKLTDKAIKNAKAPDAGRAMLWDSVVADETSLPGSFGLRVSANGVKSWIIMYRIEDTKNPGKVKQQYRKVGSYPSLSLAEAREVAREALKLAGQGIDPIQAKESEKRAVASIKSVRDAVEVFIQRYAKQKNRSWKEVERVFNYYIIPKMGDRPLPSITPGDIHDVLDTLMDAGHPYMANRVFAHTRKFFNWCSERHWISEPPTKNISRPAEEQARDRILDNGEVERLWQGCGELGWPFGPYFKLLLITGQRRNEVAGMKWDHIDLGNRLWTLPKEETKAKRQHEVPLSPMAVEILEAAPQDGTYVFSTTGKTPISGFSKAKKRWDEILAENLTPWRLHDIRRTVASGMAEIGIAPHVIEKVLNHSTGQISGVAAVYNRYAYTEEKRTALVAWSRALEAIVHPSDTSNVVEMNVMQGRESEE
jgi:integrase